VKRLPPYGESPALIDRGLSAERPVVILSGNDRERAAVAGAQRWA
jgi:hypothetical protein